MAENNWLDSSKKWVTRTTMPFDPAQPQMPLDVVRMTLHTIESEIKFQEIKMRVLEQNRIDVLSVLAVLEEKLK